MNVGHSASSRKNLKTVSGWMTKMVPSIQKWQRICDKCRNVITSLHEGFGNEAVVSSCSEYYMKEKEVFDSFKNERTHFVSSLNKTLSHQRHHHFPLKSCHKWCIWRKISRKSMSQENKNIDVNRLQW
jgi:hypothetical protein